MRLANAVQLSGRVKWAALQALVMEFLESSAAHATLVRMACKNGGSVGVGHNELQAELSAPSANQYTGYKSPEEAADAAIMLRSCEAGERLDPGAELLRRQFLLQLPGAGLPEIFH